MLHLCEVRPHKSHVIFREVTVQEKQKMLKIVEIGDWREDSLLRVHVLLQRMRSYFLAHMEASPRRANAPYGLQ